MAAAVVRRHTEGAHPTSLWKSLERPLPCTGLSCVGTKVKGPPLQKGPLHFTAKLFRQVPASHGDTTNLISAIVNRRTNVHIIPRISFKFPSMMSGIDVGN